MEQPKIIVIGGPNGAGKSTSSSFLGPEDMPFLNADEIAKELGRDSEGSHEIKAGKLFFAEGDRLHMLRQSFCR